MSSPARLPVVLMWHMHQPHYRDALTGRYVLPWTYLHATKDYVDMAAHLESNPRARAVVNFTPVLIEQLQELADAIASHLRTGSPLPDPVLALLGPDPVPQAPAERLDAIRACLRANRKQMIERFGPYLELATIAETLATPERVRYASDQFVHDLAVWYHLAWIGETVRRSNTLIAALTEQGRGYTADQRRELLVLIGELVASVVPRFRRLSERGQCELSVTPYGHPLMPLMFDFKSAREAMPDVQLPKSERYPGGAERVAWHVAEGLRIFTQAFGARPVGCWPSEGAVSRDTLEMLDRFGFRWAASSAGVLRNSLNASAPEKANDALSYNRPYRLEGCNLISFFRDDHLSDRIGFTYATWHGDDAAQNLVHEIANLARDYAHSGDHVVLIALDGENAWEHYPFNGYYFLRAMYTALAESPLIELTTLSECVARGLQPLPLQRLVAGSWVHGTLATWSGDPGKNAAWDLLCEAKQVFDRVMAQGTLDAAQRAAAEKQLALCESSDWFWWFGDYNPPEAVSQFDQLYRRQLLNLYRILQVTAPENLAHPIAIGRGAPEHGGTMRRATAG
ncbi:MAG TPA: glycoside hydrolase family 57 protein [Steroidobacteraceae bacterium]